QTIEVQTETRKLLAIEVSQTGADDDVAGRQLRRGNGSRINGNRQTRTDETGREACLSGRRGVGRQAVKTVDEITSDGVRADLRVVHRVAAANRHSRIVVGMPAETNAWGEVVFCVGECLPVVTQPDVEGEVAAQVNAVLNEHGVEPLRQIVT